MIEWRDYQDAWRDMRFENDTISHAVVINVYSKRIIWRTLLKSIQNNLEGNDLL